MLYLELISLMCYSFITGEYLKLDYTIVERVLKQLFRNFKGKCNFQICHKHRIDQYTLKAHHLLNSDGGILH